MQNEKGKLVDLYLPRRCSATNRLIAADDRSSVQVNVAHVNEAGVFTGTFTTFDFCGYIRQKGESDGAFNRLAAQNNLMKDLQKFPGEHLFKAEKKVQG